jgi:hypothetical protein
LLIINEDRSDWNVGRGIIVLKRKETPSPFLEDEC